jgi:hypothetical protein
VHLLLDCVILGCSSEEKTQIKCFGEVVKALRDRYARGSVIRLTANAGVILMNIFYVMLLSNTTEQHSLPRM